MTRRPTSEGHGTRLDDRVRAAKIRQGDNAADALTAGRCWQWSRRLPADVSQLPY
jgi:hypothetical protein